MDSTIQIQIEAYQYLERLLANGHTFHTLPIAKERAEGILTFRKQATGADLRLLSDELTKTGSTIEK